MSQSSVVTTYDTHLYAYSSVGICAHTAEDCAWHTAGPQLIVERTYTTIINSYCLYICHFCYNAHFQKTGSLSHSFLYLIPYPSEIKLV